MRWKGIINNTTNLTTEKKFTMLSFRIQPFYFLANKLFNAIYPDRNRAWEKHMLISWGITHFWKQKIVHWSEFQCLTQAIRKLIIKVWRNYKLKTKHNVEWKGVEERKENWVFQFSAFLYSLVRGCFVLHESCCGVQEKQTINDGNIFKIDWLWIN